MDEYTNSPQIAFEHLEARVLLNADLLGTQFDAFAETPIPGDGRIEVDLEVTNQGDASSGEFALHFYLSEDEFISLADNYVGDYYIADIAAGGSHSDIVLVDLLAAGYPSDPYVTDNHYWLGMIVDANNSVAESDESNNVNQGELNDKDNVSSEYHLGWSGSMGNITTIMGSPDTSVLAEIGDEWIGDKDIDLFEVSIPSDGLWGFDIDAAESGSSLDSVIHLYDSALQELVSNDNGVDPDTGYIGGDSYLQRNLTAGTYYVVVRGSGNAPFSVEDLTGRPGGSTGPYELSVEAGGLVMGDADLSGFVDDNDLSLLLANWHAPGAMWGQGDFTGEGEVDDKDLSVLLNSWHAGTPLTAPEAGQDTFYQSKTVDSGNELVAAGSSQGANAPHGSLGTAFTGPVASSFISGADKVSARRLPLGTESSSSQVVGVVQVQTHESSDDSTAESEPAVPSRISEAAAASLAISSLDEVDLLSANFIRLLA